MRKLTSMLACMLFIVNAYSQLKEVTGEVKDANGNAVPNASIKIKGEKKGTSADANGIFTVKLSPDATLIVSGVGFETKEIRTGNLQHLSVSLKPSNAVLNEVVVTALGVKSTKKAVGFVTQEVKGEDLNQGHTSNTLGALSGKVAGLEVTSSSGTPGAAIFIKLRGFTSFNGDGQPLMVIDGVPLNNATNMMSLGNVAQSNRGIDINPDDIENVTVLKGPSASALYGTLGTDGVILITTKRGKKSKDGSKFDINYGYSAAWDQVNRLPQLQMKYAQGTGGQYRSPLNGTSTSYGPSIDTLRWTGVSNDWDPHGNIVGASNPAGKIQVTPYNNLKQFFRTGLTQQHNFSISGSSDITSYRFSYSNLNQTGIEPVADFLRNTFTFNADTKLSEVLKTGASVSYINSGGNRVQEGSNTSGILLGLARTPNTFDNSYGQSDPNYLKAYQLPNGTERTYRGPGDGVRAYYDNPYWTVNKNLFRDQVNRLLGSVYFTYNPVSWVTVTERLGTDLYSDNSKQNFALYSATVKPGQVDYTNISYRHVNNDLLLTLTKKDLVKGLNGSLLVGNSLYSETFANNASQGTGLTVPDFYDLSNTSTQLAGFSGYTLRRVAYLADAKFDYRSYLFLDLAARAENSSAFVSDIVNKGKYYFFPSANLSFVFTDALKWKNKIINFGKLRMAYGQAGRLPGVFGTGTYYSSGTIADGFTTGNTYPINGQQGFFAGTLGNPKLKPELTESVDVGADLQFFQNRLGLNFTYYTSTSKDLLLSVPISPSSGYGAEYTNAASLKNHGIEITLTGSPIRTTHFSWDVTVNWSMNRSLVTALGPGIETVGLGGFTNGAINAVKGQPFGQIYGVGYVRDASGKTVINDDPSNAYNGSPYGYPIQDPNSKALGNPNPQWIGGIQNSFTYKGFSFRFLFDTKQKFDQWNGTRGALVNFGTAAETVSRGQDKVFSGVSGHLDAGGNVVNGTSSKPGSGAANTVVVQPGQSWFQGNGSGFTVVEPFVEDASFVKLRELSLSYHVAFRESNMKKIIKGLDFSVIGHNLLLFTKYKGVDPETSLAGPTALGIDYFNNPGTRSVGFNVRVNL